MKISDSAVKLLKQYATRPRYGLGVDPSPTVVYYNGVQDGVSILAEQLLEQIKHEDTNV